MSARRPNSYFSYILLKDRKTTNVLLILSSSQPLRMYDGDIRKLERIHCCLERRKRIGDGDIAMDSR